MLIGLSKAEIDERVHDIIDFSELGDFIDEPLKTYSSGMVMRLAFSIAIHSNPSILIVDEALSVGDAHFSAKCTKALKELKEKNLSIIYVSHDLNSLKLLCDRLILLHKGEIVYEGDPESVINKYNFLIAKLNKTQDNIKQMDNSSYGTLDAYIEKVAVSGTKSHSDILSSGEEGVIEVVIKAKKDLKNKTVGILIRDKFAQDIFGTNTYYFDKFLDLKKGKRYKISFKMPFNIGAGKYTVSAAIHSGERHSEECLHWVDNAADFEIAGIEGKFFIGVCRLTPVIDIKAEDDR
ncbi:lipopolysaccharide transport system ATP-binding protein [Nitratiruptor sp. YY08-14]|nr:lipopolysaccharide transport system ATP-binding protein [Nitratiruptor sp. YY08-10]BCD64636.1 lipopolysaccharide transport system ATP-binding protein [Nitratiruptor sp. YY08-14]